MKLFELRGIRFTINPLLAVAVLAGAVFGVLEALLVMFASLIIHEIAHGIVADGLGYGIKQLELQLFGSVLRFGSEPLTIGDEFAIAVAGPVCSFFIASACIAAEYWLVGNQPVLQKLIEANLSLALINLLPALPLDGGRMLRAALAKVMRPRNATITACAVGIVFGAAMLGTGAVLLTLRQVNLSLLGMGANLVFAAAMELKAANTAQLKAMFRKQSAVRRGDALELKHRAIHYDMTAHEALKRLSPGQYNLLTVVDSSMRLLGTIGEGELIDGIMRCGRNVRVGKLLGEDVN